MKLPSVRKALANRYGCEVVRRGLPSADGGFVSKKLNGSLALSRLGCGAGMADALFATAVQSRIFFLRTQLFMRIVLKMLSSMRRLFRRRFPTLPFLCFQTAHAGQVLAHGVDDMHG